MALCIPNPHTSLKALPATDNSAMVIVIGAGAAGLALGHALQQRTIDYVILEQDKIGNVWSRHYDRLHLHTLKQVSGLPGLSIPKDYPDFPSAAQVQAYLVQYAEHFQLNIREGVAVTATHWHANTWHLETTSGEMNASTLAVTTGIWSTPVKPSLPGEADFHGHVMHANGYKNAAPFAGQHVLVVGVGNSGSEIALDLSEHGVDTCIAVRDGAYFVPRPASAIASKLLAYELRTLPTPIAEALVKRARKDFTDIGLPPPSGPALEAYPVVGYELPEAVAAGRVKVVPAVEHFTRTGVQFMGGAAADFDTVILATGYRPTLSFIQPDQLELDNKDWPKLDEHWRSVRNPNLICLGFRYPSTEGWLQSIGRFIDEAVEGLRFD